MKSCCRIFVIVEAEPWLILYIVFKRDRHSLSGLFSSSPQADVRESGTLTEHELSDAMRSVMGTTPKAAETSRVLRFFGEPGAAGEGTSEWRILLEGKRREGDGKQGGKEI